MLLGKQATVVHGMVD